LLAAPYGVTHTHFAVASGSAFESKFPYSASRKSGLGVASVWSSIIERASASELDLGASREQI